MKKALLLISLLFVSCTVTNTYKLYQKDFAVGHTEEVISDIDCKFEEYNLETVPLKDWIYVDFSSDTMNSAKRVFSYIENPNKKIYFVFSINEVKDSTYYRFNIFSRVREKK